MSRAVLLRRDCTCSPLITHILSVSSNRSRQGRLCGTTCIGEDAECIALTLQVLTDLTQHYTQFALSTTAVEVLTPEMSFGKGFKWRESRRVLYLRDDCIFTVTDYDVRFLSLAVCDRYMTS